MGELMYFIIGAVLVAGITFFVTYFLLDRRADSRVKSAQTEADRVLEEAETKRREVTLAAKDEAIRLRSELDRELTQRRVEIERIERRIEKKEENIDDKAQKVEQREQTVRKSESRLQSQQDSWENEKVRKDKEVEEHRQSVLQELDEQRQQQMQEIEQSRQFYHNELERVAGLTAADARDQLIADIEAEARHMAQRHVHEIEREAKDEADKRARKILATTIQRIASDYVSESTVSVVPLPNDDMKGRIIGREGRNIRALETATGVDLIVDDTPEAVTVSGFDPVRREVARRALQKLLQDGRISTLR